MLAFGNWNIRIFHHFANFSSKIFRMAAITALDLILEHGLFPANYLMSALDYPT
jgi:hypothetical protein